MNRFISFIFCGRGSSLISPKPSLACRPFSPVLQNDGHVRGFSSANWGFNGRNPGENVNANARADPDFIRDSENRNFRSENNVPGFMRDRENINSRSENIVPGFMRDRENINSRSENNVPGFMRDRENINSRSENIVPGFMRDRENINSRSENNVPGFMQDRGNMNPRSENNAGGDRNFRHMDFVRGIIDEDGRDRGHLSSPYHYEQDADFVHIKMLRNNTFVTVTDSKGNIKLSGSAGSLKDMKSGQKLSRYAAEATAEVVGRRARGLGLKSVVMKVNGYTHFRRKRQAILSWREGFTDSKADKNPIVFVEDTTRRAHNGCRLPKKRRI
ncbi:uncharacterized protein LOC130738437 [Lotus japonicus]|nr:uncharacterized protein LOC130738437 [Lotus japonicus]